MTKTVGKRGASNLATIGQDLMLAPLVATMRLPLMAAENGHAKSPETLRAVQEKVVALAEGAFAAQMAMMQSAMRFWPEVLSGRTPSLFDGTAVERSISAALKPASRKVKANYRRLAAKA